MDDAPPRRPTTGRHGTGTAVATGARTVPWRHLVDATVLLMMLTVTVVKQGYVAPPDPLLATFVLCAWAPLLLRRRWPAVTLVLVLLVECNHLALIRIDPTGMSAGQLMGAYQPVPVATAVALFAVAAHYRREVSWGLGTVTTLVLGGVAVVTQPVQMLATDVVMCNLLLIATAAGSLVRERAVRAEAAELARRAEMHRHVTAERMRIARELHDSLAHNLTLVNAQVNVAAYLVRTDPAAAAAALDDVGGHTRRAIDELRATVGLLRHDDDAEATDEARTHYAGLGELDDLVAGFAQAHVAVTVTVQGEPCPLDRQGDLAAYRIVQEALTNAAKHAPGAPVRVRVTWTGPEVHLAVTHGPAPVPRRVRAPGTGHGLIGMRERAGALGGTVQAGPTPDGGFAVTATLPVARATPP